MNSNCVYTFRPVSTRDLQPILDIQRESYPVLMQEYDEVVKFRIENAGVTSYVAMDSHGVCAYLFSYPSVWGEITGLGAEFHTARMPDTLYIHDLAVAKCAIGSGCGSALESIATGLARRAKLDHIALVSVQNTYLFWKRRGYSWRSDIDSQAKRALKSYPDNACYMTKKLDGL